MPQVQPRNRSFFISLRWRPQPVSEKAENLCWCPVVSLQRTMMTKTIMHLFLKKPIGTPVPNNVKGDVLLLKSDVHTQLRPEAAQKAASQPGNFTNNIGFSTVPAWDLEYTNISKCRNSRGSGSNNNGDGKQQFPGLPS